MSRNLPTIVSALLLAAFVFCEWTAPRAAAQSMLADWTGVVSDPSRGAIPNSVVTLIKEDTKAKRTATTDAAGTYRVDGVMLGSYTIEVEAQGFKKYVQSGITVRPAEVKRLDVTLEVGPVTERVEVKDAAPAITTESPALSQSIPKVQSYDRPLMNETRAGYTFDMTTWIPGSSSGNAIYSLAGNLPSMQQTNLEGVQHDQFVIRVPTSAVSEVNVVMSNAPAEYARPVTLDASFRSGTDRLTGEVMFDFVNPCLNAPNTPFVHIAPSQHRACPSTWRRFYTAGGPVYIPKVYDGRGKTHFFFTLNKNPSISQSGLTLPWGISVPTLALQSGDFSHYPKTINDPVTGKPFAGNIIPPERISTMAKYVAGSYLGPACSYLGGPENFKANCGQTWWQSNAGKSYLMKFDHNLKSRDIISGSYMKMDGLSGQSRNASAQGPGGESRVPEGLGQSFAYHVWTLAETHTFSPAVVNELRTGVTRSYSIQYKLKNNTMNLGDKASGSDFVKAEDIRGLAPVGFSGAPGFFVNNWIFNTPDNQSLTADTRYSAYDNVSIHVGRHTVKFGYSAVKLLQDGTVTGNWFGNFTFNGLFTGESWGDFLLGLPSTFDSFTPRSLVARRRWEHGAFIQDDFRVNANLILYYGLRWDRFTQPYDKNDEYYNYDPVSQSIIVPDSKAASLVSPAWPTDTFPIKLASAAGFPSKLLYGSNSFQPRFGFAYRLGAGMVLRGGYGIYNGALRFNALQVTGPFAISSNYVNLPSPGSATGALYALPDIFPPVAGKAQVASITGISPHYRSPYSQNWNLTLEREIMKNWGLRATYRGVKTTQLLWTQNLNTVLASATPFSTTRRPFPNLSSVNYIQNGANDNYHAMVFEVTHPWLSGLYMTAAYTLERSGTTSPGGVFDRDQTASGVEYSYDRQRDYGPNNAYPTQDFIMNFTAETPFGHGKRFASGVNRFVNGFIGNWTLVGSFSWRSGWFFTPLLQGVDPGNLGVTSSRRPDLVPGCDPYGGGRQAPGQWFNPGCFVAPPPGQLANVRVNSLVGPGAWVFNLNPFKDIPLGFREGTKLRIGANIYNLFNHPSYANPNNNLNSATAGLIVTDQYARGFSHDYRGQRQMVMDLRLIF